MFKGDDEVPEIMSELPNPWSRGKGNNVTVNFDGNQKNGRNGSPYMPSLGNQRNAAGDFGGINYDNTQINFGSVKMTMDDNMQWEKEQGVLINPTGKYKDTHNGFEAKEIDLSQHIECIGMPNPNINHNSSDDCYGG